MTTKPTRLRRWAALGLTAALLASLLAACSGGDKENDSANVRTLRIGTMYGSAGDEVYFRQQYTDMFEFANSNIEIEIVPAIDYNAYQYEDQSDPNNRPDELEEVKKLLTGDNPVDVMILNSDILTQLVRENLLVQLDAKLQEAEIDVNAYVPTVIDGIREMGDGFIYAMTPTFNPSALFYNKGMFDKLGVPAPTDNMSWDDLFNLAKRLKQGEGKDATWGFSFSEYGGGGGFWELQNYAQPLGLRMYDDKAETMTVNTPQWEQVWTTIIDLYNNKFLPKGEDLQIEYPADGRWYPFMDRPFFNGKVAMTIGSYRFVNELVNYNNNIEKIKNLNSSAEKIEWDVVTLPYHATNPGVVGNVYLNQLTAINANAKNPEDAWRFLEFTIGKEWAKLKSRSVDEMPALKEFIKPKEGLSYNIEAFYKMKPAPSQSYIDSRLYREKPNLYMIQSLGDQYYNKVMQGEMTVKEALAAWETKGNDVLQKIKANPTGPIEGVFDDVYGGNILY